MPQIDQLTDGNGLRIDDKIPAERSSGTVWVRGLPSNPPSASDTGTDTFEVNLGDDIEDGEIVIVDIGSLNTTNTPTLENTGGSPAGAKTITLRNGEPLWANALLGPHVFQYVSSTDTWLLFDPRWITSILHSGHIDGLELSNNSTDSDHDIDIATGVCSMRDGSGNRKLFELSSSLTKQIDADWSEGTDSGGFPSGLTLSADTEYIFFVIGKDDGSVDAGFDTDSTATNLLSDASNYSWFRRIGSVFTDGSSNILAFTQQGDKFLWNDVVDDLGDGSGTLSTFETVTLTCPANQRALINVRGQVSSATNIFVFLIGIEANTGTAVEDRVLTNVVGGASESSMEIGGQVELTVDGSSQIQYTMNTSNGTWNSIDIGTVGWIDDRGRNA